MPQRAQLPAPEKAPQGGQGSELDGVGEGGEPVEQ